MMLLVCDRNGTRPIPARQPSPLGGSTLFETSQRHTFQSIMRACAEPLLHVTQDWDKANSSQTAIPFERQYTLSDDPNVPILKQNVGMFTLSSGAEVHIQSFGIYNLTLWDDVFAQFEPLTERDTILVGKILHS